MRSPRLGLIERLRAQVDETRRFIDCGARPRLYDRGPDGRPVPVRWLPRLYGGVYDSFAAAYVPGRRPAKVIELKVHRGQLQLFELLGSSGPRRVLGLGAPGGGKSMGIVAVAIALALRHPNGIGGVVAPTGQRLEVVWRKVLELLEPAQVIRAVRVSTRDLVLANGTTIQFRAAARRSDTYGSPIAGHDWQWAVEDEQQNIDDDSCREVDARGRIARHYQVFSSATNDPRHEFQTRLQEYEANPEKRVVRFAGPDNCFTPLEHWEALRRNWSAADYERLVNCVEVPREGRVYPTFSYRESTRALPTAGDVTPQVTAEKFQVAAHYVVGWDPGVVASASVILKAFRLRPHLPELTWFVVDEVTTRDATTEFHARDLAEWFQRRGVQLRHVLVVGDPHENKEADRSDYHVMQAAGFATKRANGGAKIERKHRLSMVNALLCDAAGERRLFLAAGPTGPACATKTAECFGHLMYTPSGDIDMRHKTYLNLAHWGDAVGYGVFPWERIRGAAPTPREAPVVPMWGRRLGS